MCESPPHGVTVIFAVDEGLSAYFKTDNFQLDYSTNIQGLPYGIAVIPFVCNILPIIWLTNTTLYLDELDEDFYNCIENITEGYKAIYPELSFNGKIECKPTRYEQNNSTVVSKHLDIISHGYDLKDNTFIPNTHK